MNRKANAPFCAKTEKVKTRNEVNLTSEKYLDCYRRYDAAQSPTDLPGFCLHAASIAARI